MARVSYLDKSQVAPEVVPIYEELEERIGKVLKPHMALAHSPQLLVDWWKMMVTLLSRLDLDAHFREIALLRIFRLVHCEYCFVEHERIALEAGVTQDQIDHIDEYESHSAFNHVERLVMRYAEGITVDNSVDDALFDELRKHFSERELVELTFCIGNWNGIARFVVPMGLELETPKKA